MNGIIKSFMSLIGLSNSKVTSADKEILSRYTLKEIADFSCLLNRWEWPDILPNPEANTYVHNGRRMQLMQYIESIVGAKYVNRRWNKDRMTDDEHEAFWNSERLIIKEGVK